MPEIAHDAPTATAPVGADGPRLLAEVGRLQRQVGVLCRALRQIADRAGGFRTADDRQAMLGALYDIEQKARRAAGRAHT
jgi:hypothetical protein